MSLEGQSLWMRDKNAKSISYFSVTTPVTINKKDIEELKQKSKENNNSNIRLCLHSNPDETLHDMIILEYQDKKCRKPHKHLTKDETLHIIEGEMISFIFDEKGNLIEKTSLNENSFAYRTAKNQYHVWIPTTEYVVYREIKQGPFQREDNISPEFDYTKVLEKYVDFMDLACNNLGCKNPCSLNCRLKDIK